MKLKFTVINCSSEDEQFPPSELNHHGPTVRGWKSQKHCSFPQNIILKLERSAMVNQIQILAHQFLIPERIDLWVGPEDHLPDDKEPEIATMPFDFLGYILLSENSATHFKSRELKSVSPLDSNFTSYVKISLHQNHPNHLNMYDQVSIVAIQLLGEEKKLSGEVIDRPCYTSTYEDLSFEMYVHEDMADTIRSLDLKKQQAVKDERYEYAKKLKSVMQELRTAGEKLGKLDLAKKQAIQQEDFTRAKRKKNEMEQFRNEVYDKLRISELLEPDGPINENDLETPCDDVDKSIVPDESRIFVHLSETKISHPSYPTPTASRRNEPHQDLSFNMPASPLHYSEHRNVPVANSPSPSHQNHDSISSKGRANIVQPIRTSSDRRNKVVVTPLNSYEAYDDRAIATQKSFQHSRDSPATSKLNERDKKHAALPISVFGLPVIEKFFSKHYSDKEEGLRLLEANLRSHIRSEFCKSEADIELHSPNKKARAATFLLHRALRDKVYVIYSVACEITRFFFSEFVCGRVTSSEIAKCIEKLLPELLTKSGDTMPRIHTIAIHTILSLADAPSVRALNIIPTHLTRALSSNVHPRLALSKLEMVEQLILNQGISTNKQSGMTCRTLAELGSSGLHHPAEAVRKVAERILIQIYKVNPRLVRKQLPPDDDVTRRNILYRHLMQEFENLDSQSKEEWLSGPKLVRSNSERSGSFTASFAPIRPSTSGDVNMYTSTGASSDTNTSTPSHSSQQKPANGTAAIPILQKQCIFCQIKSDQFTEEGLNIHYWKYCLMLMRCAHCQEVVEVMSLREHLLVECDAKKMFKKCEICHEPIFNENWIEHQRSPLCIPYDPSTNRCPLCHKVIGLGEDNWREHLTGSEICVKHPRRIQ
uniref:Centrosomal protein of 104 kDa n=1 Tax=Cacopsylla melanoneura TaxID=428564 RepID=A0A8D8T2D6_9HEMI